MEQQSMAKKLIVLIEDAEIVVSLLKQRLEREGYEIKTAVKGEEGLRLIYEHKPDLVLLDMSLPDLSGFDVLQRLSDEHILPGLPVIIISNSGQPIEIERAQHLGIRDYLIKVNFNPDDVFAKVEDVLTHEKEKINAGALGNEQGPVTAKYILIVEDDAFLSGLLEKEFTQKKYNTFCAQDVSRARRILQEEPIDFMLLDVRLPDMDGFLFLAELKTNDLFKHIPVLIISNVQDKDVEEKALRAGAIDYIVKAHASPDEIVERTEKILRNTN